MTTQPVDTWPPCPAPFNMAAHVLHAGASTPDKPALIELDADGHSARIWTYAELIHAVRGVATGLLQAGGTPGDRVLLRLGNTADFPITYLGALAAGLVAVPTSPQLTPYEITRMTAQIDPRFIVQSPNVSAPETDSVPTIPLENLRALQSLPSAPWHLGDPNRPGYIVFTSGTSGHARAVVHGHRAIWARGMMHAGWYGLRHDDRLLHAGAFNWTFTLGTGLMDPWTCGATALIPAPGTPPEVLPSFLAAQNVTLFAAAPGVFRKLVDAHVPPLPHLRHGLSAGEKLPDATRDAWERATRTEVFEAFGMSECSTFISAAPGAQASPGTLGRPQAGRRVALLSENGAPVAFGETGMIAVHKSDPGLMLGYLDAPEATAERMQGEWFLTGDLGTQQANGDITYQGRSDDMMNAGGFRVSPLEVEAAFADMPELAQVAATQIEIKPGVQVIALFYSAARAVEIHRLEALASQRLARYKQPRLYLSRDTLPTSANGKLLRRVLRDTFEASHDQA